MGFVSQFNRLIPKAVGQVFWAIDDGRIILNIVFNFSEEEFNLADFK